MGSTVTFKLYDTVLNPFLTEVSSRSALKAATKLRDSARAKAPKGTGVGAASIDVRFQSSDDKGTYYLVGPSLQYMAWQNNGTGPITPRRPGGTLRFKAGGVFVFAKRTRGVPAVHFMEKALAEMTVEDYNAT